MFSYKEALPSYAFMLQKEYTELTTGLTNYTVPPSWIVGHSRHATKGAINSRNAHPFSHGNITLVHNGTLVDQDLLPDSKAFEVDSENICHSINKIGAAETIQKLDGAFTLIWHDASDNRLHIIRNDERPFHLARLGTSWFGASEEAMLMWILQRSKSHKNRIDEHFECKVGTEYIFDVSDNKMTLVEEVVHELPVFTVATRWGSYYSNSYSNNHSSVVKSYLNGNSDEQRKPGVTAGDVRRREAILKQNKIASDKGVDIRRDMQVDIIPHEFVCYKDTDRGKMVGYIYDDKAQEYIEGDVHNILQTDYEAALKNKHMVYRGTVGCISEVNSMIRLVLISGHFFDSSKKEPESTTADFDDDIPFDAEDSFVSKNGVTITRKFWEAHSHGDCGGCDKHIDWKEAPNAIFAYQAYWHKACFDSIQKQVEDVEEEEIPIGVCSVCGEVKSDFEFDNEFSKLRGDDVCKICADKAKKQATQVTLKEGYVWTKYVDTTSARRPEVALRVDQKILDNMLVMEASTKRKSEITLEDVFGAYIEKRWGGVYAIAVTTPKEESAPAAETFRESKLSITRTVASFDGNRSATFTKALWSTLGICAVCFKKIPWRDAELCTLNSLNQVVCDSVHCKGHN